MLVKQNIQREIENECKNYNTLFLIIKLLFNLSVDRSEDVIAIKNCADTLQRVFDWKRVKKRKIFDVVICGYYMLLAWR